MIKVANIVALLIVTFREVPPLKYLERGIRGFLHALAHIPEGVRRTVAQMRSSEVTCNPAALASQTKKILEAPGGSERLQLEDLEGLVAPVIAFDGGF
jgi:hypothetical protein